MRFVLPVLLLVATSYAHQEAQRRFGGRGSPWHRGPSPQRIQIRTQWQPQPKPHSQNPADPVDLPDHPVVKQQALPAFTPLGEQGRYIPVYDPVHAKPQKKQRPMPPTRTKSGPPPYRQPPRVGRRIPEYRDTHLFNGARPRETPIVRGPPPPSFSQIVPPPAPRWARREPRARPPTRMQSLVYAPTQPPMPTFPPTMPPPSPTVFMTYDRPEVKKEEEEER